MSKGQRSSPKGRSGVKSILAGLGVCPSCESSMTRVNKGSSIKSGKPYLVCSRAKAGAGCEYKGVRLDRVEEVIYEELNYLLADPPLPDPSVERERRQLEANYAATQEEIRASLAAIAEKPLGSLISHLELLEQSLAETKNQLDKMNEPNLNTSYGMVLHRASECLEYFKREDRELPKLNAHLRRLFSKVEIDYVSGVLEFHWHQGGTTSVTYGWGSEAN